MDFFFLIFHYQIAVNEIWTLFHNCLSKTRVILTPEPEIFPLTHTHTPLRHSAVHCPVCSPQGAACPWSLSCRRALQPFPKSIRPFVWGRHLWPGSVIHPHQACSRPCVKVCAARSLPLFPVPGQQQPRCALTWDVLRVCLP